MEHRNKVRTFCIDGKGHDLVIDTKFLDNMGKEVAKINVPCTKCKMIMYFRKTDDGALQQVGDEIDGEAEIFEK